MGAERLTLQMFDFLPSELVFLFDFCAPQTRLTPAVPRLSSTLTLLLLTCAKGEDILVFAEGFLSPFESKADELLLSPRLSNTAGLVHVRVDTNRLEFVSMGGGGKTF